MSRWTLISNTWFTPACVFIFAGPPLLPVDIARRRPEVGRHVTGSWSSRTATAAPCSLHHIRRRRRRFRN